MQGQKPATASEQRHLEAVASLWCLTCAMNGWDGVLATVQHVVEGRERLGHLFVWPGCEWCHLGRPPEGYTIDDATAHWGPSLAHEHKRFQEVYAPERDLVDITQRLVVRKLQIEVHGDVLTPQMYGDWVRHEALVRFGKAVTIGR